MAAKKTSKKSPKEIKKTKKNKPATKASVKPAKKAVKKTAAAPQKKTKKAPVQKPALTKPMPIQAPRKPEISRKAAEIFKGYYREGERIFLRKPRKFSGFPDLLALQKK